jgi:hypothetical protein
MENDRGDRSTKARVIPLRPDRSRRNARTEPTGNTRLLSEADQQVRDHDRRERTACAILAAFPIDPMARRVKRLRRLQQQNGSPDQKCFKQESCPAAPIRQSLDPGRPASVTLRITGRVLIATDKPGLYSPTPPYDGLAFVVDPMISLTIAHANAINRCVRFARWRGKNRNP